MSDLRSTHGTVAVFGLDTFGDVTEDAEGNLLSKAQVIRNVIAEAVVADQHGIDVFGIGEHHRDDFAVSSPETVLAAIAGQTSRIRLGSAVTVLSSDDPVRVFERFSTLNAASSGRAEVILGRGSFTESFPLFGYDLSQYELLFEEKLALFAELLKGGPVSWRGTTRTGLSNQHVYPELETPAHDVGRRRRKSRVRGARGALSAAAHARHHRRQSAPLQAARRLLSSNPWLPPARRSLPVAIHSPGFVAESDEEALEEFWPHMKETRDRIGAERGWGPMTRASFDHEASEHGIALHRLARDRRAQDRPHDSQPRRRALRHEVQRRAPTA